MTRHIHLHIHRTVDSFVHRARTRDAFVETQHPRGQPGNPGEFTKKGSGTTTAKASPTPKSPPPKAASSQSRTGARSHLPGGKKKATFLPLPDDRAQWPAHIRKLKIPPAWTKREYNSDPKGEKLVTGYDEKGRKQPLMSAKHSEKSHSTIFNRIKKMIPNVNKYETKNAKNLTSRDQAIRQHAEVLGMIMAMGLRPGSDRDTKADEQAYGITTMQARHLITDGNKTYLRFTGKSGVQQDQEIPNKELAQALKDRAKRLGPNDKIFQSVDDDSLRKYTKGITNQLATPKDFRTLFATRMAADMVAKMPEPTTKAEYKKAMKAVGTAVSGKLGNTLAMALKSYISPYVWSNWKIAQ